MRELRRECVKFANLYASKVIRRLTSLRCHDALDHPLARDASLNVWTLGIQHKGSAIAIEYAAQSISDGQLSRLVAFAYGTSCEVVWFKSIIQVFSC